jgi:AraC family transcriptional regulator
MNASQAELCNAAGRSAGGAVQPLSYFFCSSANDSEVFPDGAPCHLVVLSNSHGRVTREVRGRRELRYVHPGAVTVVPKGTPVGWWWNEPLGCSVLALDDGYLSDLTGLALDGRDGQPKLQFSERPQDDAIASIAGMMAGFASARGETHDPAWTDSLARVLALHLLRNYAANEDEAPPAQPAASRAVAKAIAFIEEHYQSDLRIEDIAEAACLSPFHFSRLNRRETGLSPHRYLIRVRVEAARRLLSGSGSVNLSEVASAVGFYDQSHLTRHFRRAFGTTPGRRAAPSIRAIARLPAPAA